MIRVSAVAVLVLAISAAAALLAAALVVDVRGPFDHVFAVQHGAQVTGHRPAGDAGHGAAGRPGRDPAGADDAGRTGLTGGPGR